jgi:hypothetical protein
MIRILFGSALPVLGLGAAVALLGPDLITGPRGEPLIVAAPGVATLQEASFDGAACAFPLILDGEYRPADPAELAAGAHVVTLAFRRGPHGTSVVIEKGATNPQADEAILLVFDDGGRIVAVTRPPSARERMLADAYADCLGSAAGRTPARI